MLMSDDLRSRRVVIARIRFLDSAQMLLAQCNVMIDALATDRSD